MREDSFASIPADVVCATDYLPYARRCIDDNAWAYISGGAGDEQTLRWNREAFDRQRLLPRLLAEVSGGHTRVELFGHTYQHPLLLAPIAWQRLVHPLGELATAQAAAAQGGGMVLSTLSSVPLEDLPEIRSAPHWFQLYVQPDPEVTFDLVRRAEAAGYAALVVTVDAPVAGARNREQRAGFVLPPEVSAANLAPYAERLAAAQRSVAPGGSAVFDGLMPQALTWAGLADLRQRTRLPLLLKGVLAPDDARRALDCGVDGLIVSNHGGRVLDTAAASLDCLPAVVAAVAGRVPVLVDGGIQRGTDVLKAVALGASAVLLGRCYLWALAVAGPYGVAHLLRVLRDELEMAMALCGCRTLAEVDQRLLSPLAMA